VFWDRNIDGDLWLATPLTVNPRGLYLEGSVNQKIHKNEELKGNSPRNASALFM
jgi:hypothetical protein